MGICRKRQSTIQAAGLLMFQSSRSSLSGRQRLEQVRPLRPPCQVLGTARLDAYTLPGLTYLFPLTW